MPSRTPEEAQGDGANRPAALAEGDVGDGEELGRGDSGGGADDASRPR
jgi:hypothetical protein